ncbi:hypothetical protein BKA67DRAFT_663788 [Truncatella angustata]|uniref:Diphthamide biosynthesis protein 3 n=1 Tax=Truncatella angustata TaxID=152316 RepID=A0A9P8RME9_9PEZI|nr:uncharacterized protein BKA67DRAFT_663788 [Truncatella angustata]KAH6645910.1 hypothetical protein BKA67DRAFT_663788 [Truncatella angustata]
MADEEVAVYDEVEIEDMTFDEAQQIYTYPCPCGDQFQIALADLEDESTDIAVCPSCSLMIRVIYDMENLWKPEDPEPPAQEQSAEQVPIAA